MDVFLRNKTYELNFISLSGLWYVESPRFISTLIPTPAYCFGSLMHEGGFRNWNIPGVYITACFTHCLSFRPSFLPIIFFLSAFLTDTQVFLKNFIIKGSHMHWNTASKQGSCSPILNFPCLCAILIVCHFCLQSRLCVLQIKTYGNMKGGAVPSLSSRDRLPGLAVATPGLCYVPHKSSSCFTNALPHLSAGLICQAELPGKFFCKRNRHSYKLHFSCPLLLFYTHTTTPTPFLQRDPLDAFWCCWQLYLRMPWQIYIVLLHLSLFQPRCWPPHVLIRTLPQFCNSKQNRYPLNSVAHREYSCHGNLFPFFDSWRKTLTGSWKPQGN